MLTVVDLDHAAGLYLLTFLELKSARKANDKPLWRNN